MDSDALAQELEQLRAAWMDFIGCGCSLDSKGHYVHAYFALLRASAKSFCRGRVVLPLLKRVVGFETFQISGEQGGCLAGILNVRNPAYLLKKLAQPNSKDDPKYLPLICPLAPSTEPSQLYCHYRRIPIAGTRGIQLFVYPPVAAKDRPLSYSLMGQVFSSLTLKSDPWVHERSCALFRVFGKLTAHVPVDRIHLLDLACGSAKITMTLCKKAFARAGKPFDLTLVDVVRGSRSIANTFFRNLRVFGNVLFHREDLFDWVSRATTGTPERFDIALMLRICDVFSRFHIERMSLDEVNCILRKKGVVDLVDVTVLQPDRLIEENRVNEIQHSLRRIELPQGATFAQFSLSSYFQVIHAVLSGVSPDNDGVVFVPVRRFDNSALVLPSGRSLIDEVTTVARCVVIEDADLSPRHLEEHCRSFGLSTVRIMDVTRRTRMRGAWVCLIDRTDRWQSNRLGAASPPHMSMRLDRQ
jgi:hypothetical protein